MKNEEITERDKNGKPIAGRYSYGHTNLKPCPFCGGEAKTGISNAEWSDLKQRFYLTVSCSKCAIEKSIILAIHANTSFDDVVNRMNEVIKFWNERAEYEQSDRC